MELFRHELRYRRDTGTSSVLFSFGYATHPRGSLYITSPKTRIKIKKTNQDEPSPTATWVQVMVENRGFGGYNG